MRSCIFSFWSMQPAPAPRDRPFTLQDSPRYAGVRGVTGQKRSPARGFVTCAGTEKFACLKTVPVMPDAYYRGGLRPGFAIVI